MSPSPVSDEEWICRFIVPSEGTWDDHLQQPTPEAFRASNRELSTFSPSKVNQLGNELKDLCIDRLQGAGEAHLQVATCIKLGKGISDAFDPEVYWRPEKVAPAWLRWQEAHVQIESKGGNAKFPITYRSLLAENASCLRPPDPD